ncbi:DDE-type integrase/transposase/recombinase [Clostridium boliviensis]|uniref:DDE-type integrase/transposase/recombinase n=1 Tax=Clostridium boliviensis TaxID=318465 RepID=A0ABU4GRU4_9CLOT|nr:DDE-type integrase/transposase/recombinase [Clostridium boliviensis]MDW2799663.1 DDE-type integrase/transposase/recombinase [Clostridium boliviensis]
MQNEERTTKHWQDDQALERFQMISPLLDESLDIAKRVGLREQLSKQYNVSTRSLYRYESFYHENGFSGLRPMNRVAQRSQSLPENFDELVGEAIQLKREVPSRSVAQIILILELEGRVAPGVLKRSTMQRYLYKNGFGKKQMKKYTEARKSSSKRFCKPHRMMLVESDIKYGLKLPIGPNASMVQTYLVVIIDNHSRYVLEAKWYDHQRESIVEDCYHRAVLKHGRIRTCYHDNGKQFVSRQLIQSLSKLGIRVLKAKPYSPQSKGGVEVFNRFVNAFLAEASVQKIKTLEELNQFWDIWLEEYYHNKPHEGIEEYYKSLHSPVPAGGISPLQEWNRDSQPLVFLDATVVGKAFQHHETREVDKGGCIRVGGQMYETSTALIGAKVEISYDPLKPKIITVSYSGIKPFPARPLQISEYCDPKPEIPASMLPAEPESSRLLEGLKRQRERTLQIQANALSFSSYGKEGEDHV